MKRRTPIRTHASPANSDLGIAQSLDRPSGSFQRRRIPQLQPASSRLSATISKRPETTISGFSSSEGSVQRSPFDAIRKPGGCARFGGADPSLAPFPAAALAFTASLDSGNSCQISGEMLGGRSPIGRLLLAPFKMSDVESGKPSIPASERPRVEAFGIPAKFALAVRPSPTSGGFSIMDMVIRAPPQAHDLRSAAG